MQLIPVIDVTTANAFLQLPVDLYKGDSQWIQPLNKDVADVFDPKKNKAFRFGKASRWLLKDDNGKIIGRVAAFVNSKYKNKGDDIPVGGIGFFECINSQAAADMLLNNAKEWLQQNGMQAMDGPINFGDRDRWWGMVVKGFQEPLYCMNYNPPYYVKLFETYGFKPFYHQFCFSVEPAKPLTQKIKSRHAEYLGKPGFVCRHLQKNQLEKYATDFAEVYNKAWAGHGGLKQMETKQAILLFKKMKPVMDEKIIWFAYHEENPIAMFVNLPDLNQWFRHLHGKFGPLQLLKFLWLKTFVPNKKFNGLVFGVIPEWQAKGIDAFIIGECARQYVQTPASPYKQYEMQWIGDFNPKMINVAEGLGETFRSRELITFRYLFNREKAFKRHPIL